MSDREELFEKRFLGTLTPVEAEELKRLLREDVDAQRAFVRHTQERGVLVQLSGRRAERARRPRRSASRGAPIWIFGAVAAAALLLAVGLGSRRPSPPPPKTEARKPQPPDPEPERHAQAVMEAVEKDAREAQERLAALERQAADAKRRDEDRKKAAEEFAAIEARRKAAELALEKAREEREKSAALQKPAPAPPTLASVATLEAVRGDVILTAGDERLPAATGRPVLAGQGVAALGAGASATLAYADGSRIELGAGTVVQEVEQKDGKSLFLARGAVTATVTKQPTPLRIRTPQGEASVLGTKLKVAVEADATRVEVREGKVRLSRASDQKAVDIPAGQYAVASPKSDLVARPLFAMRVEETFDAMPAWAGSSDAAWGSPAAWTVVGRAVQASRTQPGSSVRTLVFDVPGDTRIEISAAMRGPKYSGGYFAEFGFRLGVHGADDFDANPGEWTIVNKFDGYGGQNGNGNQWVRYAGQAATGTFTKVTVGFKHGSRTPGAPAVGWDALRISY